MNVAVAQVALGTPALDKHAQLGVVDQHAVGRRRGPIGTRSVVASQLLLHCGVVEKHVVELSLHRGGSFALVLVVSRPKDDGRVGRQATHHVANLLLDRVQERMAAGIQRAGEHELLPNLA